MKRSLSFITTAVLFLLATIPVHAGVSAEVSVATPEIAEAPFPKGNPNVATNGDGYFVVWRDNRGAQALLGTRVSRSGEVLDPLGIRIAESVNEARVVWARDSWLVVWTSPRISAVYQPEIMVARIEPHGLITKIAAVAQGHSDAGIFVATNGSRTAIVYLKGTDFTEVRAVVIDSQVNVLGDHQLTAPGPRREHLSITGSGDGFFAAWNVIAEPQIRIEGARLDDTGRPLAPAGLLGPGFQPRLETGGDGNSVVLFLDHSAPAGFWATRQVPGDPANVTSPSRLPMDESFVDPTLVRAGDGYLVLAENLATPQTELTAVRLDAAGKPVDEHPRTITNLQVSEIDPAPTAVTNGSELFVVWIESSHLGQRAAVRGQLFDATTFAPRSPAATLSQSARYQTRPAVAFSGTNHLAVWTEIEGIRAGRLGLDGQPLDGPGLFLGPAVAFPEPAVVFDGRSYVVAWSDFAAETVVIRFIDPQTTLGNEIRVPAGFHSNVVMATSGEHTVVVWTDESRAIVGMRVGRDSQQLEVTPVQISHPVQDVPPSHLADFPAIAWNGTEFLVAWMEYDLIEVPAPVLQYVPRRIRGTRLSASLLALDPGAPVLGDTPGLDHEPALASLNGEWLLVWMEDTLVGTVRARRIGRDLTPAGDAAGISLGAGFSPRVTSDGTRWIVGFGETDFRIRLLYLTRDLVGSTTFFDVAIPWMVDLGLAPSYGGRTAVVYSRLSLAPEHGGIDRVFVRFVSPPRKMRAVR